MATPKGTVAVPLPPDLREFVKREAERHDRPMAWIVRKMIAEMASKRSKEEKTAA